MKRHSHYEAAFEHYLQSRQVPYVPVDESRKTLFSGSKIKSFDFLVYPAEDCHWIVDVKGRNFPYLDEDGRGSGRYWENWVTREDLSGLGEWQTVFGEEFEARFVFAYLLQGPPDRWPSGRPHVYQEGLYAFWTISLADYRRHCRRRSPVWETVCMPRRRFRELARPVGFFCRPAPPGATNAAGLRPGSIKQSTFAPGPKNVETRATGAPVTRPAETSTE